MKIGIITVHNGQNYGASLQAYALVKKLRNMGFDAYLVDYRTKKIEERLSSYRRKEKYNSFSNILKNLRSECSELLFDTSEYLKLVTERFEEFHQLILDVNSGEYHACDEMRILNKEYDAFICGSDQIWNPNITDLDDSFFLRFADESSKRVAYAPSLGMRSDSVSKEMEGELKEKLQQRQEQQSYMKKVNAYYRKNGTMKGFEGISDEKAAEIDEAVKSDYSWINAPYAPYELSNNNAEINRLKKRIESLERREETGFVGWQFEGGEAVANTEENRLQLLFDEKPSEEQRSKLKGWGFRWSPSNKAWQRQLNSNAIYAAGQIDFIKPLDGRTPRELQPKPKAKDEQER